MGAENSERITRRKFSFFIHRLMLFLFDLKNMLSNSIKVSSIQMTFANKHALKISCPYLWFTYVEEEFIFLNNS